MNVLIIKTIEQKKSWLSVRDHNHLIRNHSAPHRSLALSKWDRRESSLYSLSMMSLLGGGRWNQAIAEKHDQTDIDSEH